MHPSKANIMPDSGALNRGGQTGRGTGGDQIMLLHVLTAAPANEDTHCAPTPI